MKAAHTTLGASLTFLGTAVVEHARHHDAVARPQLRLHGERPVRQHVVVPQVAAGGEARGAVGAIGGRLGDEQTHAAVAAQGVGFLVGLPVVVDDVVAVEALGAGPRANDEALGVVQLGLGDAGDDLVAALRTRPGSGGEESVRAVAAEGGGGGLFTQ